MRLTLRTMLAYLDDILSPADALDVSKKIEESEFATSLMHRTRDVTRRLRLGAPKLHGRGMGLDPNTVAEYLDNTLLSERVADFEKVCLESDVHLAEVAACHQILALVLGEPAEIEATGRQRMYALISQPEATRSRSTTAKDDKKRRESAARSARKKKRRRPKVPEYLREPVEAEPRRRRWALPLAVALLLAGAGVGLATYWPEIARRWQVAQVAEPPDSVAPVIVGGTDADQQPAGTGATGPEAGQADGQLEDGQQEATRPDANADRQAPDRQLADQQGLNQQGLDQQGPDRQARTQRPTAKKAITPRVAADDMTGETAAGAPKAAASQDASAADRGKTSARPAAAPDAKEEAPAAEGVGRLISEQDVLLRAVEHQWQRVPGRGTVYAGERLIALPTYRPSVALSSGMTLQLLGGAIVEMGAAKTDDALQIRLDSGRLLLLTVAKPGAKIRLQAGDFQGTIEFGKEEANVAVEVRHVLPEGADPEQEPAPTAVDIYVASGEVTWLDPKGRRDVLRGRAHRSLNNPNAANPASEELPAWIEASELNPNERRASTDIASFLRADKPVAPALSELATHRRIENSLLATQCLALIDEFEPVVPLLHDKAYRTVWTSQIESLRSALARGPQTAALVREAFTSVRGNKLGTQLYRMLWGYNSAQLDDGAAAQLIEWLGAPDDELDLRVLAFWNLHHITGLGLYYQPGDPEKQRRTSIQRWKQKLESGLISPKAT